MTGATEAFDAAERGMWDGRVEAYAGSFARLCAHPVEAVLDVAGVGAGTYVLDVGTGTGTAALAAPKMGSTRTCRGRRRRDGGRGAGARGRRACSRPA